MNDTEYKLKLSILSDIINLASEDSEIGESLSKQRNVEWIKRCLNDGDINVEIAIKSLFGSEPFDKNIIDIFFNAKLYMPEKINHNLDRIRLIRSPKI